MIIAVDCYELGASATGVGRSIENVLKELVSMMPEERFVALSREPVDTFLPDGMEQRVLIPDRGYFLWQTGPLRRGLRKMRPDVLIAPNYSLPLWTRWPSILTVYDVSFVSHPEWYTRRDSLKRKFLLQKSLRKAAYVVTASKAAKGELMKYLDIEPGKIEVAYLGVDDRFRRSTREQIEIWKRQKGFEGRNVVGFLGSIFNRRHIPLLVEAVERLRKKRPDFVLHIVGRDMSHPSQNITSLLKKDWITWEERLPAEDIPLFYSALSVFAYISEYEGFGLPPLEALACGTVPVVLNRSSLGEIFEGMSFLVEEPGADQVAEAIERALDDEVERSRILEAFLQKRALFSWKTAADLYKRLLMDIGRIRHA